MSIKILPRARFLYIFSIYRIMANSYDFDKVMKHSGSNTKIDILFFLFPLLSISLSCLFDREIGREGRERRKAKEKEKRKKERKRKKGKEKEQEKEK